ncbi:MAG: Phospholipase/carboxylesterase family protein, partial [uncultured Gemmatimonadetes bacterium]
EPPLRTGNPGGCAGRRAAGGAAARPGQRPLRPGGAGAADRAPRGGGDAAGSAPRGAVGIRAGVGVVPLPGPQPPRAGELRGEPGGAGRLPGGAAHGAPGAYGAGGARRLLAGRGDVHGVRPPQPRRRPPGDELQRLPRRPPQRARHRGVRGGHALLVGPRHAGPADPVRARPRGPRLPPGRRRRPDGARLRHGPRHLARRGARRAGVAGLTQRHRGTEM